MREALGTIFSEADTEAPGKEPTRSLRGLLAKYGPAPSAEEIDRNRAEMFANFPRSDLGAATLERRPTNVESAISADSGRR